MRITQHPILNFDRGKEIHFTFNGQPMTGFEGETIAAALHAAGVKVLGRSLEKHRPRGFDWKLRFLPDDRRRRAQRPYLYHTPARRHDS